MADFCLVLGTRNAKKRRELSPLLAPYPIELKTLDDFPSSVEVEETGSTFAANAELKAVEQALAVGQWVMGEDSGISVAALDGRPGIYSARYSDPDATDEKNNVKLLEEMANVPTEKRTAWYTCSMCLADPQGQVHVRTEAYCYGRILNEQKGSGGFGYDPMFELPEYGLTFGELGDAVKSLLSHRARATRMFLPKLLKIVEEHKRKSRTRY